MLRKVSATEYHTAWEPFRIVAEALAGPALRHESIVGSVFTGTVVATTAAGRPAVVPQVTAMAYRTGEHTFVVEPADPLVPGFVLR